MNERGRNEAEGTTDELEICFWGAGQAKGGRAGLPRVCAGVCVHVCAQLCLHVYRCM